MNHKFTFIDKLDEVLGDAAMIVFEICMPVIFILLTIWLAKMVFHGH
jgi:hypothetical protein